MVWINDSNIAAIHAAVSDPIPAGTTFVAGGAPSGYAVPIGAPAGSSNLGVSCTADPASSDTLTTLCYYEGPSTAFPRGRIVWQGVLGPDFGAADAVSADDELAIVFNLTVNTGITSVRNTATIDSDLNGDGDAIDAGETQVASATAEWTLEVTPTEVEELPSTGFAPGLITVLPPQPASSAYTAYNDLTLEIPALSVKTAIVGLPFADGGWDATWLGNTAGWLGGTAFPTWKGNSVITGHVYNQTGAPGPFANLGKLKYGDRVIVYAFGQKYVYEVRSSKYVEPDDTSVLGHKSQPWLTLLTCREFDEKTQSYKWRLAVQAVLVSVEKVK
jgi:LPXTG-site transpeptidase (sortase) family protein